MTRYSGPVRLGYEISDLRIDPTLQPLMDETVDSYLEHHNNLRAVYVIGSSVLGDWKAGISDLDVIGITDGPVDTNADVARRQALVSIGDEHREVSFVDNTTFDINALQTIELEDHASPIVGLASKLALTGLCVWGQPADFQPYLPSVGEMAYGRTDRVEALMHKYRSGNLIPEFRRDERLLVRSCAKAAMRVLSGTTLLRGADYHPSPYRTSDLVDTYTPEARVLNSQVVDAIDDPTVNDTNEAMLLADSSVALFRQLF